MDEKPSIYQDLIDAGIACGEIAGIVDVTYLKRAHQRRQRIVEAAGSASLDGRPTSPERLYAWLGEVPLQAQANLGAEGYAASIFNALNGNEKSSALAIEAIELQEQVQARVGRDILAGAAALFSRPDGITPESRIAFSRFLRANLGPAEPSLSPLFGGAQAAVRRSAASFDRYIAERLARAARRSLANARALRAGLAAANSAIANDRASSHVREIMELLFAGHPLSVSSAARIFGISRLAARKHLLRLEQAGLADGVSRGRTGVVYVARDGIMTFHSALPPASPVRESRRPQVSTFKPLSIEERNRLDAVADDVADRMRDLDALLQRLSRTGS